MQQYALTQQALSKAVKSPAEIAAARAAEISKQLEASGASEKKISERSKSRSTSKSKSKSKSLSPSPSHSRSKSKSRSPSCSPVKRRRGRSRSLSPIRYRRDYYPSYRSRDHYGYRGYNYRSYYRGSYNDYPRYRYGRDYDYQYRRRSRSRERRRSRTRSRSPRRDKSRGRRRSPSVSPPLKKRSLTGSPKDSRKGSVSPPIKRDGSRSQHSSLRSLSREAARSGSVSSGSVNVSSARGSSRSVSQEKSVSDNIVHKSPPIESSEDSEKNQIAVNLRRQQKGLNAPRRGRTDFSSSPTRSLSISLDNDKYIHGSNKDLAKKRHERPEGGRSGDYDEAPISPGKKSASEAEGSEGGRKSYPGHGRRGRLLARSSDVISDNDSKSDESMDDWRDDLKKVVKGKGLSAPKEDEDNRLGKMKVSETQLTESAVNVNDSELKQDLVAHDDSPMVVEGQHAVSDGHGHVVHDKPLAQAPIFEEPKKVSDHHDDRLVFEGPQPANVAHKERKKTFEDGLNSVSLIDADAREMQSPISDKIKAEEISIAGDDDGHLHHSDGHIHKHEDKYRDRSRSRDSKKGGAELAKHESRRGKHKRHRKKHKHQTTDEESEGTRKRHRRKHRRESDHGHKERKKRRHKRRSKLSSDSAEDSSSDGEIEVRSSSKKRKKASKKRKATKRDVSKSSTSSTS